MLTRGVFRTFELRVLTVIDCPKIAGAKAPVLSQGLLHRWTSQLDFGITAGGLERAISVHNST